MGWPGEWSLVSLAGAPTTTTKSMLCRTLRQPRMALRILYREEEDGTYGPWLGQSWAFLPFHSLTGVSLASAGPLSRGEPWSAVVIGTKFGIEKGAFSSHRPILKLTNL